MKPERPPLPLAMKNPAHPERICWGCDQFCPAESLGCANGSIRTPHPKELFGDDWEAFFERRDAPGPAAGLAPSATDGTD